MPAGLESCGDYRVHTCPFEHHCLTRSRRGPDGEDIQLAAACKDRRRRNSENETEDAGPRLEDRLDLLIESRRESLRSLWKTQIQLPEVRRKHLNRACERRIVDARIVRIVR